MSKEASYLEKMTAEGFGTFLLTFIGAGSIIAASFITQGNASSQLLLIALAHGVALAIAVTIALGISGGQINPAVTIALLIVKKIKTGQAVLNIMAQLTGAITAGFLLVSLLPQASGNNVNWGTPSLSNSINIYQGIGIEAIITFFLVMAVFGTAIDSRTQKIAGFGIGLMLMIDILVAGPFTGGAANPARAIGPAIASMYFKNWYVYWIGPILGGIIAALFYNYLILKDRKS